MTTVIWSIHLICFLHPVTIWDVLLLSIIKYESGNRPYLLSVFRVNWQLQFQEVLFLVVFSNIQRAHGLKPLMQKESPSLCTRSYSVLLYRLSSAPLLSHAVAPVPSTCRPPLCRWEDHNPPLRSSVPDASESVRWGPASQFASVGGPSWWC